MLFLWLLSQKTQKDCLKQYYRSKNANAAPSIKPQQLHPQIDPIRLSCYTSTIPTNISIPSKGHLSHSSHNQQPTPKTSHFPRSQRSRYHASSSGNIGQARVLPVYLTLNHGNRGYKSCYLIISGQECQEDSLFCSLS